MNGLEQWHHGMKEGDMEALYDLLHPDCVFISPVVHTPQEGRLLNSKSWFDHLKQ